MLATAIHLLLDLGVCGIYLHPSNPPELSWKCAGQWASGPFWFLAIVPCCMWYSLGEDIEKFTVWLEARQKLHSGRIDCCWVSRFHQTGNFLFLVFMSFKIYREMGTENEWKREPQFSYVSCCERYQFWLPYSGGSLYFCNILINL